MVQLKALTPSARMALKIECTAMQSSQQRSVHELLKEKLPGPLEGQWAVTAARSISTIRPSRAGHAPRWSPSK